VTDTSLTASGRPAATPTHGVSLGEALRVWLRIAALSFGGPAGQIAVMHRIIVDEKKWVGENRFLHALRRYVLGRGRRPALTCSKSTRVARADRAEPHARRADHEAVYRSVCRD
jgi:Chromate transporter